MRAMPSILAAKALPRVARIDPTEHPLFDTHGLILTAFAALRVDISCELSARTTKMIRKVKVRRQMSPKSPSLAGLTVTHVLATLQK